MRILMCIVSIWFAACRVSGREALRESDIVQYARHVDVSKLDSSLSAGRLDEWIADGPPRITNAEWTADCDLKGDTDEPKGQSPVCAKVKFKRNAVWGWMIIVVGTNQSGIGSHPVFKYAVVTSGALARRGDFRHINRLSELPPALSAAEEDSSKNLGSSD